MAFVLSCWTIIMTQEHSSWTSKAAAMLLNTQPNDYIQSDELVSREKIQV